MNKFKGKRTFNSSLGNGIEKVQDIVKELSIADLKIKEFLE